MGQELEVRPGIVSKDHEGKLMCKPIFSKIVSLFAEHNDLQYAAPGGLIGNASTLVHLAVFEVMTSLCLDLDTVMHCLKTPQFKLI